MRLSHLGISNFRNYRSLDLELPPGLVVFHGDNAQGKTNLLEAVHVLATSRSFRTARERELIAWSVPQGEPPLARLVGRVVRREGEVTVEVLLMGAPDRPGQVAGEESEDLFLSSRSGLQKRIRVNGVPRRAVDVVGTLQCVLFRPEDIDLIAGSPSGRRRALDVLLAQGDRRYLRALQRYNRLLLQRNHLLRRIADGLASQQELAPWDDSLVREAAVILGSRLSACDVLSSLAAAAHRDLSEGAEALAAAYIATAPLPAGPSEDPEQPLLAALQAARARDLALGQTTVGPHRDDLSYTLDGAPASAYGSRGQQRTIALAWKLAEARYLRELAGEDPLVLLDDAFSELDERRRASVLRAAGEFEQVFLTTTFTDLPSAAVTPAAAYRVSGGSVSAHRG